MLEKSCLAYEQYVKMQFGISTKDLQRLTLLPESLVPHSPLSYHHLFFSLSKMPCSLSFNTARFTGVLHVGNNINNIILCYFMLFNFKLLHTLQSDKAGLLAMSTSSSTIKDPHPH